MKISDILANLFQIISVLLFLNRINGLNATAKTEPRLWQYGCWKTINLTKSFTKDIPSNNPGACYEFCESSNTTSTYFALQGTFCSCISTIDPNRIEALGHGCNWTCPGNRYHYCGSDTEHVSSVYYIEANAMTDGSLCTKMLCNINNHNHEPTSDTNCSETATLFCGDVPSKTCPIVPNTSSGTWMDIHSACDSNSEARYNSTCDVARPLPCAIGSGSWVGAFGRFALQVNPTTPPSSTTADTTTTTVYLATAESSTTATTNTTKQEEPALSIGVIIGIMLAVLVLGTLTVVVFLWKKQLLCFSKRRDNIPKSDSPVDPPARSMYSPKRVCPDPGEIGLIQGHS